MRLQLLKVMGLIHEKLKQSKYQALSKIKEHSLVMCNERSAQEYSSSNQTKSNNTSDLKT